MKKVHLLVNLKSGSDKGAKALKEIEAVLKKEKFVNCNNKLNTFG